MKSIISYLLIFSFLFVITSCQEKKTKVPYYRIDQTYTTTIEDKEVYFDLTTSIYKINRYSINDYASDRSNMYGMKITGIHEDQIEKYLLNEYSRAEKLVNKYKYVDQMIDKDYKHKTKNDE